MSDTSKIFLATGFLVGFLGGLLVGNIPESPTPLPVSQLTEEASLGSCEVKSRCFNCGWENGKIGCERCQWFNQEQK